MGVVAAVAAGVGLFAQYQQGEEAKKASEDNLNLQKREYARQQKLAEVQNIRSIRQQLRAQRLAQSTMTNTAANKGGMGSSGLAGGVASAASQTAGNLGMIAQQAAVNATSGADQISTAQSIGQHQANAATWGMVGGISSTVFGAAGGPAALASGANSVFDSAVNAEWKRQGL